MRVRDLPEVDQGSILDGEGAPASADQGEAHPKDRFGMGTPVEATASPCGPAEHVTLGNGKDWLPQTTAQTE